MGRIRVLVVEDSATVRHHIGEVLAGDPDIDIAGMAEDGAQAIELCRRTRPDVITMDMMLPGVSGLAATEYIMAHCPTPILVVSSSTNRTEALSTCQALAAGAVDVLDKPHGDASDSAWGPALRSTVKLVARIPVITHPRARLNGRGPGSHVDAAGPPRPGPPYRLVAIGASTGGPGAVVDVLRELPPSFTAAILLVQHISAPFATAFGTWLAEQIGRPAGYARDGEPIAGVAGRVALAPPGSHLVVRAGRLHLSAEAERHSCRPSIDVLFESIARDCGPAAAGCVLTGMGRDGAAGLLAMHQAGCLTFAQNEETSIVYGMPREAARLGAAADILAPREIGRRLARLDLSGFPLGET
jgi:two-component system chemotaxis response regulator CheB